MLWTGASRTALVIAAYAATAACGSGDPGEDRGDTPPATSAKPSATATKQAGAAHCPLTPVVKASGGAAMRPAINAAARYLAVREARLSACESSNLSWENEVEHLMTGKGWQAHPRVDYTKAALALQKKAKRNGWYVRANVTCRPNLEAGRPTATLKPLFCTIKDKTVDAAGRPVPAGKLPATWKFNGPQDPAPMSVKKKGGTWLVDLDATGLAQ